MLRWLGGAHARKDITSQVQNISGQSRHGVWWSCHEKRGIVKPISHALIAARCMMQMRKRLSIHFPPWCVLMFGGTTFMFVIPARCA